MAKEKFYMTTAIAYTSGKPHIGNTYEIVLADSIARFKRQQGYDVFFQTGTDEHGQKIELKAEEAGITPKEYVDNVSTEIKRIWDLMNTSYGPLDQEMIGPDAPEHPTTPYGVSKLAAGKLSKLLCKELGIEWIWPRIFSVYGIYDKESTMVMTAIHQFLAEEETAFTPGEQEWDYLYSKDAGRAFYLIGEKGRDGSIYCVGSGKARRLYEYIYQIRDVANPKATPGIGKKSYGVQPVMHLCADISSLKNDTGFEPAYEFSSGIREMVRWMKEKDK